MNGFGAYSPNSILRQAAASRSVIVSVLRVAGAMQVDRKAAGGIPAKPRKRCLVTLESGDVAACLAMLCPSSSVYAKIGSAVPAPTICIIGGRII